MYCPLQQSTDGLKSPLHLIEFRVVVAEDAYVRSTSKAQSRRTGERQPLRPSGHSGYQRGGHKTVAAASHVCRGTTQVSHSESKLLQDC